jgi:hypothetical protein
MWLSMEVEIDGRAVERKARVTCSGGGGRGSEVNVFDVVKGMCSRGRAMMTDA